MTEKHAKNNLRWLAIKSQDAEAFHIFSDTSSINIAASYI